LTNATPANNSRQHAIAVLEQPPIQNVYVHSLSGTGSRVGFRTVINGQVQIRTGSGEPAPNASVTMRTTGSLWSTNTQTVTTNANGMVSFSVDVNRGTYTVTVTGAGCQCVPAMNNVTSIPVST
jgi:hypothetical protein